MGLELRPTCKPVETGDLELRIRNRLGTAGLEQILGLILQMPEIGTRGKRTWCVLRIGRHSDLLSSKRPWSAYRAERRFAKIECKQVGFYPFRGPDASFTLRKSYQKNSLPQKIIKQWNNETGQSGAPFMPFRATRISAAHVRSAWISRPANCRRGAPAKRGNYLLLLTPCYVYFQR